MGFWETVAELTEAALPWTVAVAEAPAEDQDKDKDQSEEKEDDGEEGESKDDSKDDDEEGGDDEEEEEEEEIVDPKEKYEEECRESKGCAPAKHHFDECVERVTGAQQHEEGKHHVHEDCVEEFFHLTHCATQCAAPKVWSALK